jgi:hypothetical protein
MHAKIETATVAEMATVAVRRSIFITEIDLLDGLAMSYRVASSTSLLFIAQLARRAI